MDRWKIIYYKSPSGKFPVKEFIDNLDTLTRTKVYNTLELLTEFGINLSLPHAKKLTGTPLWELRVLGEASLRILYITRTGKQFLLLHAFTKKQQKTPQKEIKTALIRLRGKYEYLTNITNL